jgi:tripartite-type tricarboxylate transporter receptor subunit TctC
MRTPLGLSARLAATIGALLLSATSALAAFPDRPITFIVPWGAGGGTDATARIIGSLIEKDLKVPVNVVNRTGGSGVVGHSAIAQAAPDGYTIGMVTVEIGMMHWQGLTELKGASYTPLALVNADPAGVHVKADSPYKNMGDLVAAIKASPGKLKASGTGQGGIWHVALAGLLRDLKLENSVPWVPSNGAGPAMQDLVAGGIDMTTCSVPEADALVKAGKARTLAIIAPERNAMFKDIPTVKETTGSPWNVSAWRGIGAPKGLPKDVQDALVVAIKRAHESKEFRDFMAGRGFGVVWAGPEDFATHMARDSDSMGGVMKALGLAK